MDEYDPPPKENRSNLLIGMLFFGILAYVIYFLFMQ